MPKRMLIDATHAEETRVSVVDGNRLVEFDYESKLRKQLKGSIFLAKVTRVEPSLQAAFVNFGGNRHGFLPFSEIHPDYFRIPVADREALLAAQQAEYEAALAAEEAAIAEEEAALAAEEAARTAAKNPEMQGEDGSEDAPESGEVIDLGGAEPEEVAEEAEYPEEATEESEEEEDEESEESSIEESAEGEENAGVMEDADDEKSVVKHKFVYRGVTEIDPETLAILATDEKESTAFEQDLARKIEDAAKEREDVVRVRLHYRHSENGTKMRSVWVAFHEDNEEVDHEQALAAEEEARERRRNNRRGRGRFNRRGRNGNRRPMSRRSVEMVGGEGVESDQPFRPSLHRNYKIQEVIKRGQIMLIQVQKEERGNKGAAVTSYLSLPGRYCVLMPNSPRGGGVSRKIASFAERRRMREILRELGTPDGMSVILRTAGVEKEQDEIKRDLDYLMRLWDNIRDLTIKSSAPAIIYEESNLVKRAVRDIYAKDIEEIQVSGQDGYKQAKEFMKLLMPSSVKKVKQYKDEKIPLFHRYQVENQIAEMGEPVVNLKSGGYLVINPTEALVSIDVNSGRATKERHIEETALKTNLEAADEVARQLRLRDLGGLVVIDFIDMEEHRNNGKVERRLREALSGDRARIQIGRISNFGLLELSRQRLNPSLTEAQFEKCPHCKGVGNIRTVDSATILALRALEEEGIRSRSSQVFLTVPNAIALYILNQKRDMLADIERRYGFNVFVRVDEELAPTGFSLESVKASPEDMDEDDETGKATTIEDASDEVEDKDADEGDSEDGDKKQRRGRGRDRDRNRRNKSSGDDAEQDSGSKRNNRNRKSRSDDDRSAEETGQDSADQQDQGSAADTGEESAASGAKKKKGFQAKRFGSRKSTAQTEPESGDAAQEESAQPSIPAGTPSNDVGEPDSAEDNGSSDDSAAQKKKGWWNRLID